ncbi:MAG: oligoendopeptidase F [Candidatus Anammoximicrobium sp.]|nr:oligoendopeptidase F [Candidatus Anammoximicrobium sp.]
MAETKIKKLPARDEVNPADTWDLSSLFASDEAWEAAFGKWEGRIAGYQTFRGQLGNDPATLAACLKFDNDFDRAGEALGSYAHLKAAEDQANSRYQAMIARYQNVATRASQAASYIRPEILALSAAKMNGFLEAQELQPYRLLLQRILRFKKHTLGSKEEELLAMQGEMAQTASRVFRQLHDADLKFGLVTDERGEQVELGNATFLKLLQSPQRNVRSTAFHQYYEQFQAHENTLAATLSGAVQTDAYYARARGYDSALAAALFPDVVPQSVYENLIQAVHRRLPAVHAYYDLRRRKMQLKDIHHYDTYVPILTQLAATRTWDEAVALILDALRPLGSEYTSALASGLDGRWCDRYPNRGKQSGAFSSGSYDGNPYILMNYKPEVLEDVFTLAHEAGHSMHSYYSARTQPYQYYNYTIFVAEVASTFNEQLLFQHLLKRVSDDQQRAYLINREIDSIRATIVRQTMFAEFEKLTHAMAEAGQPLTVQTFKEVYRKLLEQYFGPEFALDDDLSLECFRIPHFYRAFYVYKYATGLSAAIALSRRVLAGGAGELNDYLSFLKAGCSKDPLDLLRDAGVDMASPEPVETALAHFEQLVAELDQLL